MAVLSTVGDYVGQARTLLLDNHAPYRYPDDDLVDALNVGLSEAFKLRPDLFLSLSWDVPMYSAGALTTPVMFDVQYRSALLYYIVGKAQLRDAEDTADTRAAGFLQQFKSQLLTAA